MKLIARLTLAALVLAAINACGHGTAKRIVTRPDTYNKLLGFPSTGNPLDIDSLVKEFPALDGIVLTAPEYLLEYEQLQKEAAARGESIIPYRIPSGASVRIEVEDEPDLSRSYKIGPHGFIDYPHGIKIHVEGLTIDELRATVREKLLPYYKNPIVMIHLLGTPSGGYRSGDGNYYAGSANRSSIYLFGAVSGSRSSLQGGISYSGGETLISVLGQYGLPINAEWRQVRIIRRDNEEPLRKSRVIISDLWAFFAHADVRQDVPLMPGDVIFVPVKWTVGDQFSKDWNMTLKYLGDVLFLDSFKEAASSGGTLRTSP